MAARAKITMNPEQYLSGLKQLEASTTKSTGKMQNSFKEYGREIERGGKLAQTVSAEIGGSFGNVGKIISSVASGPVALLTATMGALVAAGVDMWDKLTLSTEEYHAKLDRTSQAERKRLASLKTAQNEETAYMNRLSELADRETLNNAEKIEAARLTEILSGKYGDLGVEVNNVTGKIEGLTAAQKKLNDLQRQQRMAQLERIIGVETKKSSSLVSSKLNDGFSGFVDWMFNDGNQLAKDYGKRDAEGRLRQAQAQFDNATTSGDLSFWGGEIDRLQNIIDLQTELNNLREIGAATVKEEAANLEAESEAERKRLEEERRAREKALAEEAAAEKKYWDERQKQFEKEQAELNKKAEGRIRLINHNADAAFDLEMQALRAMGQGREADIEEALQRARGIKGDALTDREKSNIIEMTQARADLDAALRNAPTTNPQIYAPRVDSLIARGGSATPVRLPKIEEINQKSLQVQENLSRTATRILSSIDKWNII